MKIPIRVPCLIALIFSLSALQSPVWAYNANPAYEWIMQQLFSPDAEQLYREQHGLVFIYAGLTDQDVENALDQNFDRIEAMMFVATIHTDADGNVLRDADTGAVETDGGC